jgi:hypothetical protein
MAARTFSKAALLWARKSCRYAWGSLQWGRRWGPCGERRDGRATILEFMQAEFVQAMAAAGTWGRVLASVLMCVELLGAAGGVSTLPCAGRPYNDPSGEIHKSPPSRPAPARGLLAIVLF